jgi:hypothetical protein
MPMITWFSFPLVVPSKVSGCAINTCSGYTPGQISTADPAGTAATAAEIVEKLCRLGLQVPTAYCVANAE